MPLKVSDGIGAWIKDFQKSDAPQFKGKSAKERQAQAVAAYLSAKRGPLKKEDSVKEEKESPFQFGGKKKKRRKKGRKKKRKPGQQDIQVDSEKILEDIGFSSSEFELEIDKKLKDNDFISTVAHEMVHVWQYATRQLTQRGCRELWRGKDYTDASYSKKPWERQAVRMEKQLFQDFKKTRKKNEKK